MEVDVIEQEGEVQAGSSPDLAPHGQFYNFNSQLEKRKFTRGGGGIRPSREKCVSTALSSFVDALGRSILLPDGGHLTAIHSHLPPAREESGGL